MRQEYLKSIIIIGLILLFSISSTYAFLTLNATNSSATGQGGCFVVSYSGDAITGIEVSSGAAYTSGAHSTVTLYKDSTCKIYSEASIYLHINTGSTIPLSPSNVAYESFKYKVMSGSTEISSGVVTGTIGNDFLLATVELSNTVKSYDVYFWIDSATSIGEYDAKSFSGYIYAISTQTSTVD